MSDGSSLLVPLPIRWPFVKKHRTPESPTMVAHVFASQAREDGGKTQAGSRQ